MRPTSRHSCVRLPVSRSTGDITEGIPERRHAGTYLAYIPDRLGVELPPIGPRARQAAEDALAVLARADERIGSRGSYLNHLLIRSESISSSWIEGNRITPKKLAIAETLEAGTRTALDVVATVHATEQAIGSLAGRSRPITTQDIVDLQHTIEPRLPAGLRTEQNWVGGPGWSPLRADFVPPPESEVPALVADVASFLTATHGNPVVRAAIAHAQFETIHPFIDGNGRTGRALIHTVLQRCDALRHTLIPISTVFAARTDVYLAGLTSYRDPEPHTDEWVIGFAQAAEQAAQTGVRLARDAAALDEQLLQRLVEHRRRQGTSPALPRRGAVALKILADLSTHPVVTTESAATRYGVSAVAAHRALTELADAHVLGRSKNHKGKIVCYTADAHLGLTALAERANRVGAGDTDRRRPDQGPPAPAADRFGRLRTDSPE